MEGTILIGDVEYRHVDGLLLKRRGRGFKKAFPDKHGYLKWHLGQNGKHINVFVHRVVWMCYNGPITDDLTVDHIDGDRSNNSIENLALLTRAQNAIKGNARWWKVVSPDGSAEMIYNVEEYCRVHNLHPGHLRDTSRNGRKHKGYYCHATD